MIPLTDERLRQLAYDDMVCTNANERAMAAELLSARARIAELEAAQRPPLGYVAMARPVESDVYSILPTRNLATDKLSAEMQRHRFEKDPDVHVIVAELREVQP